MVSTPANGGKTIGLKKTGKCWKPFPVNIQVNPINESYFPELPGVDIV